MKPPKLIHIQNGPRNFIRFTGKPNMIIEVWQFNNEKELDCAISEIGKDFLSLDMIAFNSSKVFNGRYFLFVVTRFPDGYLPEDQARILRNLSHAIDWYQHNILE